MKLQPADWKRNIPPGMKALERWAGWSMTEGRKVPKNVKTGGNAMASNSATWCGWDDACRWYERHQKSEKHGVGFMVQKGDGLVFVDVDDCLEEDGEKLKAWAGPLVEPMLPHCYAERSPGGRGLHLFLIASFPPGVSKSGATWKLDPKDKKNRQSIAVFDDRRYSTLTGDVYRGRRSLEKGQAQLDALLLRTGLDAKLGAAPEVDDEEREVTDDDVELVKKALASTDPDLHHDDWVKVGMALKSGLGDEGFALWDAWSRKGAKYKSGETRAKWASFQGEGVDLGSLFYVAEEYGGFTLRTTAQEDFKAFKDLPEDEAAESPYETGSLVKWQSLKLILVARGSGKNVTVKPAEGDANIGIYLQAHERWRGQLKYNDRTCEVDSLDGEPLNLHELVRHITAFMGWGRSPSEEGVHRAARAVAMQHRYDPVADWLRGLTWDGTARVGTLLELVGLEDTEMTRNHMTRWLVGCVARAFKPGCRFQTMLVLHGAQGKKKSEFFRRLATRDDWYSESEIDMRTKEGHLALLGPWIVENAELDGMTRADVSRVKVFIGEAISRFREPYARKNTPHPRRCGLGGTTNETEFLRDPTGSRRFWLLAVLGELRVELLTDELVASLWAEAVSLYRSGLRWWDEGLEVDALLKSNEEHFEGTALDGYVQAVLVDLELRSVTTVQEVLLALAQKYRVPPNVRQREVAAAMRRAKWERSTLRVAGEQHRFWVAPKAQAEYLQKAAEQAHMRITASEFAEEAES